MSSKLAHVTGYDVLSFEYRLAPEHPYPAAVEDAMRAWDYLMYQGYGAENVTVAGDSAGGNLALVLCRRLKAAGRRMPRALLLMSPWTDMTMSGASYRERVESDPMLTPEYIEAVRRAYAGDRDLHDPDLSPLLGDLGSFPPTLIQVGDHEILYSDSASLAAALCSQKTLSRMVTFRVYPDSYQPFASSEIKIVHISMFRNWLPSISTSPRAAAARLGEDIVADLHIRRIGDVFHHVSGGVPTV